MSDPRTGPRQPANFGVNLGETLKRLVESHITSHWTAFLARIEEVDFKEARAKVRPLAKLPVGPDQWVELPILFRVPIDIARAGPFYVRRPYKEKDIVICVVMSHSLERTLHDHEPHEIGSAHVHNLNDCVILGGLRADTDGNLPEAYKEDLIVQNAETGTMIRLKPNGVMELYLEGPPDEPIHLDVKSRGTYRLRSATGEARIEAAKKIILGEEAEFRIVLGERLLDWLNSHVHTDVTSGDELSGPPAQKASESLLSKLAWVRERPPGQLEMGKPEVPGKPNPWPLPNIAQVGAWLLAVGTSAGVDSNDLWEAIQAAVNSIGESIGKAVGEFVDNVVKGLGEIAQEAIEIFKDAVVDVLKENWLEFLGLALTNPAAALAMLAEKIGEKILERIGGEELVSALTKWLVDKLADVALKAAIEAIGIEDADGFVKGVQDILNRCLEDGELTLDDAIREAMIWAQNEFGQKGLEGLVSLIIKFGAEALGLAS